ncbi:TonB-dependent receptor [Spongiibacter sp. KMU-166]|uniref:TonB-dependent receptor n=1 Tax=Spongiibacter thalassae TaxID=2721624 RepID=A0ABX1GHE3_9GAMM|nr:TonB-dependent receptor [Spongiibacter thalassae]NKI18625.1 TonB-dependent receptor [Spongiibacter thalassae]
MTKKCIQLVGLGIAIAASPFVGAQEKTRSRVIEEVIVSAQKRDEAIQDVPISMSVMDANFMKEQGITDLREALLFVPNVKVEQAGFFAAPRARGFTFNNNNKAFEPPLGLAIDGVPYTRIPYFMAATYDLKRIEVLRGPQGTTFGKNTTAGVVHMLTADAQNEWGFGFSTQQGNYQRERYEAHITGPLLKDKLLFRMAAFDDVRDGFTKNTTAPIDPESERVFRGHDRSGYRIKLEAPDALGAGSYAKITHERVELSDYGTGAELTGANDDTKAFLRTYDPNTDFVQGNYVASMDAPDGRDVEIETTSFQVDYDVRDWGLVLVGGHSELRQYLTLDTDFTPAPAILGEGGDTSPTTSAEFRVVSPPINGLLGIDSLFGRSLGSSDFILGAFWQKREINDSFFRFAFDMPAYLGLVAATSGGEESTPYADLYSLIPVTPEGAYTEDVTQTFNQSAETLAFFGELRWEFMPGLSLQIGARNGAETKEANWHQFYNQSQPAIILPEAGLVPFEAQRSMEDNQFQHKISLNWEPSDSVSVFLHRAEAVKGGGFNAFAFRGVDDELQFKPEYTTEWSLNAKTTWLDNTLRANISLFHMNVEDFQVLTRDPERTNIGIGVTLVKNAAEAVSQGVEADVTWLANNWLTLVTTIGFNDTEYKKFFDNECAPDDTREDCSNASGKSFPFAPKWNNTFTALINKPLFDSAYEFTASATVEVYSEQNLDVDLDPRKLQDGFERYKASIGIGNREAGWSFRIIGDNLTDKQTGIRQGDLFPGLIIELTETPRMIYGQFDWTF